MSRVWIYGVLAGMVLASGCASTSGSPTFMPTSGSQVEVTQELSAPVGGARLYIQHGQVLPRGKITVQDPYCQFFSNRSREEMRDPLVVRPQSFTITRSFQRRGFTWAYDVQIAGDVSVDMSTVMELDSDIQPDIVRLVCLMWGSRRLDGFLTINEMKATLGGLVSLDIVSQ
jgi:hypothetical protein